MTHSNSGKALRVFISYSHDSTAHKTRVGDLAARLRDAGIDVHLDQDTSAPAEAWPQWTKEHIESADVVLCVFTKAYRTRFDRKAPAGEGRGVKWEAKLLQNLLYRDEGKNRRIVPVIFEAEDVQHIPLELENDTHYCVTDADDFKALCRRLGGSVKTPAPAATPQAADSTDLSDSVAAYVQWAKKRYDHLDLIGIDAGDVHVPFDEVYVPLKVASRAGHDGKGLFRGRGVMDGKRESGDIELEKVLQESASKPSLIFGEPGSGKTTALLKLHHLCMQKHKDLGLPPNMVPVFLRLRHLRQELLDAGLPAFLEHEIQQLSSGRVDEGIGEALWAHRRLLLLFDGLDEIADAEHRAKVLRFLGWRLDGSKYPHVRAVVSCRRVGLPKIADRDERFQIYEVRPFQDKQIEILVNQWFHQLAERGRIAPAVAEQRVATLLDALKDRRRTNQQLLQMASNPLLLTLLCVVVLLGNEIPKRRVTFYQQCLDVMLDRWPRRKGSEPPVDSHAARQALGQLAFFLHRDKRRDDLSHPEALVRLMHDFEDRTLASEFFRWVHEQVGLIVDYTETSYGFVHLGLQEYLTAQHLIAQPEDLAFLDEPFDEAWWTEVFLQISALSERDGFDALMDRLLNRTDFLERRSDLLRDCLQETRRPKLRAFVAALETGDEARQEALLRLLQATAHRPAELVEWLDQVEDAGESVVRLAQRLQVADAAAPPVVVLYGPEDDLNSARRLAQGLEGFQGGRRVLVVPAATCCEGDGVETLSGGTLIALVGSDGRGWTPAAFLRQIFKEEPWLVVHLPGDLSTLVSEVFATCDVFHWQLAEDERKDVTLHRWITERLDQVDVQEPVPVPAKVTRRHAVVRSDSTKSLIDSVTGMEFLHVPGGRFRMGKGRGFPVRVSPFWLGKTPVTNRQYGEFLQATKYDEPRFWRDRRFSEGEQPVVGVSWEDAGKFCRWLTETNPDGLRFQLPSEAQWEFAARGPKSRPYPWGDAKPTKRHACFDLNWNEDQPADVGSFPDGVGLFGHLDLAGLVLEWCVDFWEKKLPWWPERGEPLDPVGEADPDLRPVRGGAWDYPAVSLRSAFRSGFRPGDRNDYVGFRVLCAPELDP